MSTIRNAILNWADTPGIKIQKLTESRIDINTPWGSATLTLKDDAYEVESASERLKTKIEEIIEKALTDEKAMRLRGRERYDWLRG
jgi:3-methyladenine DNA glycosylase AlkC